MELNKEYEEKVYSGVLGKIIGVYLGRPFEGWWYDRIIKELGPINYYVNDKLDFPLPVSDDDITGTFTFLRTFRECNYNKNITANVGVVKSYIAERNFDDALNKLNSIPKEIEKEHGNNTKIKKNYWHNTCLLYTSPSPRDRG